MNNLKNFTVRSSGRVAGKCYIDCAGSYKLSDIGEMIGININELEEIYSAHGGKLDETVGVWYFPSREDAVAALRQMDDYFSSKSVGKIVFLTFEEMEYIRQALINEGSNIINVRNDLKKGIFDKFNA